MNQDVPTNLKKDIHKRHVVMPVFWYHLIHALLLLGFCVKRKSSWLQMSVQISIDDFFFSAGHAALRLCDRFGIA